MPILRSRPARDGARQMWQSIQSDATRRKSTATPYRPDNRSRASPRARLFNGWLLGFESTAAGSQSGDVSVQGATRKRERGSASTLLGPTSGDLPSLRGS